VNAPGELRIGDVVRISGERLEPAAHPDQSFNYVGLELIESGTGRLLSHGETLGREIKSPKNVFHPGQILYGKLRPYLNKVHLATTDGICSTDILVLTPIADVALPRYVSYFLRSSMVLERVQNLTVGANLPRVDAKGLLSIPFPRVPRAQQAEVVRVLSEAEELRDLRAEADRAAATFIPALFHEMFGSPATNPRGWPIVSVAELLDRESGGAKCGPFGSVLSKSDYRSEGVPVWGIPNVRPNEFIEEPSLFIDRTKFLELRAYSVQYGDLLVSRAGTVGRICVARPTTPESIIGTNLIRVSVDRHRLVPDFLATLLTYFLPEVGRLRADTNESAYSFMKTSVLESLRIYVPPLDLQTNFASKARSLQGLRELQEHSRGYLANAISAVLGQSFDRPA
jgi:type I restriction enzyme S subunit